MGGTWYRTRDVRLVQCPECKRVFESGISEPQCSKCHVRFWADYNLFKTPEDRQKDRNTIYELVESFKKNHVVMMEELKKKTTDNEEILRKIENLLKPI